MHESSMLRAAWFRDTYLRVPVKNKKIRILDVGSYDVNGSYRALFPDEGFIYTGLDMEKGPNVDICPVNPYRWTEISDAAYDAVISGQAFEHIEFFWITMTEMARVARCGGLICVIAPRAAERHRYPVDCYRFDSDGMVALARYASLDVLHVSTHLAPVGAPEAWYKSFDSMLVARKPHNWQGTVDLGGYTCEPADLKTLATGMVLRPK